MCKVLDTHEIDMIISGGAAGADSLAQRYAKDNGLSILIHYPDWERYGRSAGFERNNNIIESSDQVVAFRVNKSRGTSHSIEIAQRQNKKVEVIDIL